MVVEGNEGDDNGVDADAVNDNTQCVIRFADVCILYLLNRNLRCFSNFQRNG